MGRLSRFAKSDSTVSARKPRLAKLRLDSLEDRAVPASYSVAATVLTVTLNTANETVTLNTNGTSVTSAGSIAAVDGGGLATFVNLVGNNATILPTVTAINIVDTANNTKVFFADSGTNSYLATQPFTINLANTGTQVSFAGKSTFNSSFNATATTIQNLVAGTVTLVGAASNLTLTSRGNTTLAATALVVGGSATFNKSTAAGTLNASNPNNSVVGLVDFNEVSGGAIATLQWSNANSAAQMPVLSDLASLVTVNISHSNAPLVTGAANVSSILVLSAFGDITQTGALTSPSSSFTVLGNSSITLNDAGNNFGFLVLNARSSTQTIAVKEANAISIDSANIGRAALNLTAVAGDITQTGSITQLPGAGAITTNSVAASTVDLSDANSFGGPVVVTGSPVIVSLSDANRAATTANYTIPAGVTTLSIDHANAPVVLGAFIPASVTDLTASGVGVYQSAPLTVATLSAFGNSGPVVLDKAANDFDTLRVFTNTTEGHDITVVDADGFGFGGGQSFLGSGRLNVTATTGNITQTSQITSGVGSVSSFKTPAGAVTLTDAGNSFFGRVEAAVGSASALSITNGTDLTLGNITTVAGTTATFVGAGAIEQSLGTKLTLVGPSSFTTGVGILTNPGNTFNAVTGPVSLNASSFELTGTGDINLGPTTVTTLTVTAKNNPAGPLGGNITDSGVINSGGTATFNGGLISGNVTLDTATNDFGTVGGRVNGATPALGSFTVTDANAVVLGSLLLGNGNLTVTAGGNITQSSSLRTVGTTPGTVGTGTVSLSSVLAGTNSIKLDNSANEFNGKLTILGDATTLTVRNRGDIDLDTVDPVLAVTANVDVRAGKTITLPNTPLSVNNLTARASKILMKGDVTASGTIAITGSATISSGAFSASALSFAGTAGLTVTDVTVPLTLTTPGGLKVNGGTWNLGANALSVSSGGLSIANPGTRFVTSGASAINLGSGNLTVSGGAVFQAGTLPTAETTSVTTLGNITLTGDLQAGLGAAGDQLLKLGATGGVVLGSGSRLIGTGVAAGPQSVINITGGAGVVSGRFVDSVDAVGVAVPFKAGSDVVLADYTTANTAVSVQTNTASDADGTVTGFLQNGQAYSVTSSLGAAAGLVVREKLDTNGNDLGLDIVVRTNTAASTLTISPLPSGNNGPGTIVLHSVAVSGVGAVTINAPLADLTNGDITTQGTLTAATLRNITGSTVKSGGLVTAGTTLTVKLVSTSTIDVGGVLTALTAENISGGANTKLVAEKFGIIKVNGSTLQGAAAGDLDARLTTRTATLGANVASVTVAGTLSGIWDVLGDIGTVKARVTSGWSLGQNLTTNNWGAVARNPDGVRNVTTLDIGRASDTAVNITATGSVKALLATDWTAGSARAGSFGSITTKINPADFLDGANGDLAVGLLATGNLAGTAVGSITVAGNRGGTLTAWNGNIGAVKVTKTLGGSIDATTAATSGGIASLTAGTVSGLTVDAKRIGSITGVANAAAQQFGDIGPSSNTFTLRGNDGTAAKNAIGVIKAARFLSSNTLTLLGGNLGSVTVGYRSSGNNFLLADPIAGRVGSFTVGESSGDVINAESIGAITTKGYAQIAPNSLALLGDLDFFNLNSYRETGTAVGAGVVKVTGNISSATVNSPNGVTGITAVRDIGGLTVTTDSVAPGTDVIGRLGSLTGGSINDLILTGESVGAITTKGYLTPESGANSRVAGVFNSGTLSSLLLKGAGVVSGVAVGAVTTDSFIQNLTVNAPLGVASITAKGKLTNVAVTADHLPLVLGVVKPGFGKVGSISGFDYTNVSVAAASVGAVKSAADFLSASRGTIVNSSFVARDTAATATGIASVTTGGDFTLSIVNSAAGLGSLSVDESLVNSTVAAGYRANKGVGSIKAGEVFGSTIVTRQLGSFNVLGNLEPGSSLGGGVTNAFVNVFGNNANVGLGTFTALGTVSNSVFDITDGNLTSFTAARLRDSTIQVGARFTKGNALAGGVTFGATDRTLGSLALTATALGATPTPEDIRDGAGFRDSYVTAANLGTVTFNAAATLDPTTEVQGVAFKTAGASSGTITVGGVVVPDNTLLAASKFSKTGI